MHGLILIPTRFEQDIVEPAIRAAAEEHGWAIELCGFGPIASASRSAWLLSQMKPKEVLLLGIAGVFGDSIPIGSATAFDRVCCYGVGVGCGDQYQSASEVGFKQWKHDGAEIGDFLDLQQTTGDTTHPRVLLTSTAASANHSEAARKLHAVPDALAEDMEGFSVAMSCRFANVMLTIIRGISNEVGNRDPRHWQIETALESAAKTAIEEVLTRPVE